MKLLGSIALGAALGVVGVFVWAWVEEMKEGGYRR